MTNYVSLHNHSDHSLLHSLASPKELFDRAKELGQTSIAITDYNTMAGMWQSYKASKETSVRLIPGCEIYFTDDVSNRNDKLRRVVLLAKNHNGYKNILTLNRDGFENGSPTAKKLIPIIDWNMLKQHSDGIICLTGCGNGITGQLINTKQFDKAEETLVRLVDIFGSNLGVEVQANNLIKGQTHQAHAVNQAFTNAHSIRLAKKLNIKIVPTTNSFYTKSEDHEIHDALLAVASMQPIYSNARPKYNVPDFYLKSGDEVKSFFTRNYGEEFALQICQNTVDFANMCESPEWIDPKIATKTEHLLPTFDVKSEKDYNDFSNWWKSQNEKMRALDEDAAYLRYKCYKVFATKPFANNKVYMDRLEEEFGVFEYQKFSSYMLIVQDYVNWAIDNKVSLASPGRGSCAGSLVAYLLNIHKADPIKYDLIFARFQNKERKSPPDIDQDFSKKNRHKVIEYIVNKYGSDYVGQISNLIAITPKVFVKDISRACELGGSRKDAVAFGMKVADTIPKKVDDKDIKTIDDAVKYSPLFAEYCKRHGEFEKYKRICNKQRNAGVHAAGIITSKYPLKGLVPLRKDKDGSIVIEYDKDVVEENGLIKMDILGLSTLDIIEETNEIIRSFGKQVPEVDYDTYDKEAYDLISRGDTFGVFQFGTSAGTIELCKKIQPKNIQDLAIITTLARPAARDIRAKFIEARESKKKFEPIHSSLKGAFEKTFGFGLFDESILRLGQDVAGWSLHSADRIRKMIKDKGKNPAKDAKLREEFINDAIKNNKIDPKMAQRIWDEELNCFKNYTFNESHATSYSMLSFHTAYLKAHFPVEFLLANLMNELSSNTADAEDNINKIKSEIRSHNIKILSPDINKSDMNFKLDGTNLITGFTALKNVGQDAIKEILEKRPFKSFDDFMLRVDTSVRANTIQALAISGCLDSFGLTRKQIFMYCQDYRKKLQVWLKKHDPSKETFQYPWPIEKEWNIKELYALEKDCMGESFICGKKEAFAPFFNNATPIKNILKMKDRDTIANMRGEIKSIFEFKVKKETSKLLGKTMAKITIEDAAGDQISITAFPDAWKSVKDRMKELCGSKYKFEPGIVISFSGQVNIYEDQLGIILDYLFDFAPPPQKPKDLKVKKVSLKKSTKQSEEEVKSLDVNNTDTMIEAIEDDLFSEGLIDLNGEDADDNDPFGSFGDI